MDVGETALDAVVVESELFVVEAEGIHKYVDVLVDVCKTFELDPNQMEIIYRQHSCFGNTVDFA